MPHRYDLHGTISSVGFGSGDRFVVGIWDSSPVGPFADVLWARPDGTRVLLAPSARIATFVAAVYRFDALEVDDFSWSGTPRRTVVDHPRLRLELLAGRGVVVGPPRPAWCTRWIEGPIARAWHGVRTYGTSPTGVQEWYRARAWRYVTRGRAFLDGADLGVPGRLEPATRFGFTEPPRRPAIVQVSPRLADRGGVVRAALADDAVVPEPAAS